MSGSAVAALLSIVSAGGWTGDSSRESFRWAILFKSLQRAVTLESHEQPLVFEPFMRSPQLSLAQLLGGTAQLIWIARHLKRSPLLLVSAAIREDSRGAMRLTPH
jgi:ABC-type uncharacterized transport system ATPase subunit